MKLLDPIKTSEFLKKKKKKKKKMKTSDKHFLINPAKILHQMVIMSMCQD